ncbi:hypothetical protein GIS00_25910 [Nakamurella sp. YIM 132087]|uniref:Uncharacterized protein n=1 Tax=Nakamurella alba TaxID=2665158 RepID=A0A7K1FTC1_9ACTN|nr:DUF308 domain-containing protein [Nakamurella alba]MTD17371.1 hypothetical protein [Nakamurella alba]
MTSPNRDPLDGASNAEVDARFAEIIAAWGPPQELRSFRDSQVNSQVADSRTVTPDELDAAAAEAARDRREEQVSDRERRRELRRMERAAELEAFQAEQARHQAELDADTEHYDPPEPPPIPRPKRRTVLSALLMTLGIVIMVWPGLLSVAPEVVLILGLSALAGGFALMIAGLRHRRDGWDDGAEV